MYKLKIKRGKKGIGSKKHLIDLSSNLREFGLQTAVIFAHQREVKAVRKRSWRRAASRHLAVQKIRSKYKENKKKPLLGTSLGGSPYAATASKSVIRPVLCAKSRTVFKFFA